MPPYQPPHLRNRPPTALEATPERSNGGSTGPRVASQPNASFPTALARPPGLRSGPPIRNWCGTPPPQSSRSALASPANDLRPSSRTDLHARPIGKEDDMEFIQSVSRSGGDGAEGDALKDWDLQNRYRKYIDGRLDKHYKAFPGPRDRPPPPAGAVERTESLSSIVLLFRKLREGVIASGRIDNFAIEVFESSAKTAILAHNTPQIISSLSGLVPGLYQAVDARRSTSGESDSLGSLSGELSRLQVESDKAIAPSDNRATFTSLLLLFHLCHADSPATYHSTLNDLIRPMTHPLKPRARETPDNASAYPPQLGSPQPFLHPGSPALALPRKIYQILSTGRFDPLSFWCILANPHLTGLERTIISSASERVRERAWEVMRKSYLTVEVDWAGALVGLEVGAVGGVEDMARHRGLKVEGRILKLR